MPIRSDDRLLLLAIPAPQELAALARVLLRGTLVVIGSPEEIAAAQPSLTEFDNVMFLEGTPAAIPWRGPGFTKILVPHHLERLLPHIADELQRVLAPGGEIVRTALAV
ncbi:MAG TPA: hypothetical protein VK604_20320 [Bryobacteraceae bacterium]|nr:hypothetical protein [Bryobacteraceae bacterium]HTF65284.1 hypothetical protein [Edaphobacter sp.]